MVTECGTGDKAVKTITQSFMFLSTYDHISFDAGNFFCLVLYPKIQNTELIFSTVAP
jgi:hypothetical protein